MTTRPSGPLAGTYQQSHNNPGNALFPPTNTRDGRTTPGGTAASFSTAKQVQSFARSAAMPGSFASDLRSLQSRIDLPRPDLGSYAAGYDDASDLTTSEQRQAEFRDRIDKETKIKIGTENLLEALNNKSAKQARDQLKVVESELNTSNRKIAQLKQDLEAEIQRSKDQSSSPIGRTQNRLSGLFGSAPIRSPPVFGRPLGEPEEMDPELESPTYILAEILQALEVGDQPSDYYVDRANDLVELFRRHPTLKYDLAWSIFGLRMQLMLLSDSREVVAAGYRVMRYAVTDRKSLQTIRALQTDSLVILSLVKESKARVEREQALKFIRAFLDVKGGTHEIDPAIVRIIVAVADHHEDQLRGIAILTLAELLLKDPMLVVNAGGISVLADAMGNGAYHAPETLIDPFLYLMDLPARRVLLKSGFELSSAFAAFTEPDNSRSYEDRLKASARVIAGLFKSWPGLMALSLHSFLPIRSVVSSLYITNLAVRTATLDLLVDILRIQSPSWSSPFIGGRRLTTYGRVTNLKMEPIAPQYNPRNESDDPQKRSLVSHFTAVILAVLLRQGLLTALMHAESDAPNQALKRRTSLLMAEVLRMASELLPPSWSHDLQVMPGLFNAAADFKNEDRFQAIATVYQVDSINRTLYRTMSAGPSTTSTDDGAAGRARATSKTQISATMDETQFRVKMVDTGVLHTVNYNKWDWILIQELIDGPLVNPKRLQEAMIATKFVHRLLGFLRPFKFRFSNAPNTKSNQRYVRMGCALVKTLLQTSEGAKYLEGTKLVPQIGECLAQLDPMSGITSKTPLFSELRMSETLVGGYFALLGVMCSDAKGMQILERWKIINIFYHIVELRYRDDLIRALLMHLDYTLDSHPRIILSKAMIASSKQMRISATRILRKYAMMPIESGIVGGGAAEWAIKLLVSQLYDPEIEVCEVAIKILEEACNDMTSLEYVVKCRPALDHLGEIGAPLLLRFLTTSVGYHYLDGLDYITKEMDDWFLGRNDTYVTIVEASLARALSDTPASQQSQANPQLDTDGLLEPKDFGFVPPHFYRELTRTAEGCTLLHSKGHFLDFATTIHDHALEDTDPEILLKLKGCLWAVGNVGSMERGAPFLESTDVVKDIVLIAEQSRVLTLRGTAFFVLGLVARSLHGQEILAEFGWDGVTNAMGENLGYVLPLGFDILFAIPEPAPFGPDKASSLYKSQPQPAQQQFSGPNTNTASLDETSRAILASIVKLGNTVLTNKALAELRTLKARHPQHFDRVSLFRHAMEVLSQHAYKIPNYRYVIDLFGRKVLRGLVEEDSSEDESDSDTGQNNNLAREKRGDAEQERSESENEEASSDEE
ncbi:Hypothetical protein R9X50_00579100 [Acrodontium crateriforme]|uniref:Cytosolic regulator Pianissimo n=1 Tax=Acrodontium crateriforme TaxID=150365 RepID=A0AAQ3MAF1_9PEZI|nr:Hypothetical protein R9X50_00579100 [Acrodontium crateriforme]